MLTSIDAYTDNCAIILTSSALTRIRQYLFDYYYDNLYTTSLRTPTASSVVPKVHQYLQIPTATLHSTANLKMTIHTAFITIWSSSGRCPSIAYIDVDDEDQVDNGKAEIDTFLDALGYPKPRRKTVITE